MPIVIKLPWAPKVRQKDIDQFLYDSRNKFIGYSFAGDHNSLAGLPQPIHEGYNILKRVRIFITEAACEHIESEVLFKFKYFIAHVYESIGYSYKT